MIRRGRMMWKERRSTTKKGEQPMAAAGRNGEVAIRVYVGERESVRRRYTQSGSFVL